MAHGQADLRDIAFEDIEAAAGRIAGRVARTPLLHSRTAAREIERRTGVRIGGAGIPDRPGGDPSPGADEPRLFLKCEHLQVTGSFKARGAVNRVLTLTPEERERGIVTMSAGNHAAAVAYAARAAAIPVTVVMPVAAPRLKVEATLGYGARVEMFGAHTGETYQRLEELKQERGAVYISPFDDPRVIEGQGTTALEIVADLPDVDVVVVGVGGGGLLSGVATALHRLRPSARVVGVEPEGSDALSQGLAAGRPVHIEPRTIADGLGAPFAGVWDIDLARRYAAAVVRIPEGVIAHGMRFALERLKQVLEPAGATALGAVLTGAVPLEPGEVVCVVASGGNVDLARLPQLLATGDPPGQP
jgi:threonine dehydratase